MSKNKLRSKRIALFTGAGASKPFEIPLTGELLPEIRRRLRNNELFGAPTNEEATRLHAELRAFFRGIYPGFNEISDEDLPLITDVLSLLDHSLLTGNAVCHGSRRRELQNIRRLLERAIYIALDWKTGYDKEPALLKQLVNAMARVARERHVGLISTNYDILIESRLFRQYTYPEIPELFDFGCEWRNDSSGKVHGRPANPAFSVYKLHGSLNMLKCPLCDHLYINSGGDISYLDFLGRETARPDGWNQCHCDYAPLEACMIAPSSVRDIRDSNLLEIWRNALEFLRTADHWIIIGYSFPAEDVGIRSMFCRAYQGRQTKPRVTVVQHGIDLKTVARYRIMFPDCRYEVRGMEEFAREFTDYLRYYQTLPLIKAVHR